MSQNEVFLATIIETIPGIGGAVVTSTDKGSSAKLIPAFLPYNDTNNGTTVRPMYPEGSTVLCVKCYAKNAHVAFILGQVSARMDELATNYQCYKQFNAEQWASMKKTAKAAWQLLEKLLPAKLHSWLHSHAHKASGDAIAGDYDIVDMHTNATLHLSRGVVALMGSQTAFVASTGTESRVQEVGDHISRHTMTHEAVDTVGYSVFNTAATVPEAFGLKEGPVVEEKETEYYLKPTHDDAIPLYRMQHMEGGIVDGKEDIIVDFPENNGDSPEIHTADKAPSVLSRRRQALSGELSDASAFGISSVKTPFVSGAMQLGYGKKPKQPTILSTADGLKDEDGRFDDLREPYEEPDEAVEIENVSGEDAVVDAALNKLIDTLLEGDYRQALLNAMAKRGFTVAKQQDSIYKRIQDKTETGDQLPGGYTADQHYKLPPSIDLEDPVTHEKKTYYASISFITQEPDGSICICDGYGSEIRMCRGNIYISSALDTFVRPGRDYSLMAGRHQAHNSQSSCTVNSSDSMYIRAIRDLKIGGATGGEGVVTLESDGVKGPEGLAGLVIRSDMHMSVTAGGDLYVGRNNHTGNAEGRVTETERQGSLILDAGGNGAIYAHGEGITLDGKQTVIGGFKEGRSGDEANIVTAVEGSALVVEPNSIGIWSKLVQAPATLTSLPPKVESEGETAERKRDADRRAAQGMPAEEDTPRVPSVMVVREGSKFNATLTYMDGETAETAPALIWAGQMRVTANLQVDGIGKFCNNDAQAGAAIVTNGIRTVSEDAKINTIDRHRVIDTEREYDAEGNVISTRELHYFTPKPLRPLDMNMAIGSYVGNMVVNAQSTSYQDHYIVVNAFRFPYTYDVQMSVMPGMVWQDRALASGLAGDLWVETFIKDPDDVDTGCYPGADVWKSAQVSRKGYRKVAIMPKADDEQAQETIEKDGDVALQQGYVTNSIKTVVY